MGYLRFGLPQIETDMTISRDLSEVFSKKLHEPILMKPLYQSKEKTRPQLEQFSSSAPTYVYNAPLLLPGPRFFTRILIGILVSGPPMF